MRRRPLMVGALALLTSAGFMGQSAYIHAKALLAQHLIARAWDRTLSGERHVRPWPWADTWPVARLGFSGRELYVLAGASGRNLAFGPVLHPASASPGRGTTVMAGHRDTHFRALRDLKSGVPVWLEDETGTRFRYRVAGHQIIDTRTHDLRLDDSSNALLLVTCWPFDALRAGGPYRYVLSAVADFKSVAAPDTRAVSSLGEATSASTSRASMSRP